MRAKHSLLLPGTIQKNYVNMIGLSLNIFISTELVKLRAFQKFHIKKYLNTFSIFVLGLDNDML